MVDKLPDVEATVEEYRANILSGDYVVCDALVDPELTSDACAPLK